MALFVCGLAAGSLSLSRPAQAQGRTIDIPAGQLSDSIRMLSGQTGVSIGFAGQLPNIHANAVRGSVSPKDALHQMLRGSGYRAVAVGSLGFRIEQVAPTAKPPASARIVQPQIETSEPDIVVTGRKRAERLSTLPATDHVVIEDRLRSAGGIAGSDDLARETPSLSISSLGPGRNRLFLRGIGDGPLNGFNQGSVAPTTEAAGPWRRQ